jgi:hypothetical protein
MSLFTPAQLDQLMQNSFQRSTNHVPVVKLHLPGSGCAWLLTELDPDPETPSLAFGLYDLGIGCPGLGYIFLEEITSLKSITGASIERDISFQGKYPVSVYLRAARACQHITEDDAILTRYAFKIYRPTCKP